MEQVNTMRQQTNDKTGAMAGLEQKATQTHGMT